MMYARWYALLDMLINYYAMLDGTYALLVGTYVCRLLDGALMLPVPY